MLREDEPVGQRFVVGGWGGRESGAKVAMRLGMMEGTDGGWSAVLHAASS